MLAHVFYDVTRDELGRPLNLLTTGRHGDIEGHYFQYVTSILVEDVAECERVYLEMQEPRLDGFDRIRSMSVGDIVVFESELGQTAAICESTGWGEVAFPDVLS